MEGTLVPEAIAAVAAAALLVALASGRQRSAKETGRCAGCWRPSEVHGIVEPPEWLQHGSYTARRRAPRPTITEHQAREYRAASERFSGHAPSEIGPWNAEQPSTSWKGR